MKGRWLTKDKLSSRKFNHNYSIEFLRNALQTVGSWLINTEVIYKNIPT